MSTLPMIPAGLAGDALVVALNDRLRRIASATGLSVPGTPGRPGAPGTGGGSSSTGAGPMLVVTQLSTTYTPNLNAGSTFLQIVLTGSAPLAGAGSGSNVGANHFFNWDSGDLFNAGMAGETIVIGGAPQTVVAFVSPTKLQITTAVSFGLTWTYTTAAPNYLLKQPIGAAPGVMTPWTLVIDNPTAVNQTLTPDATYFLSFGITLLPGTRAQIVWVTDANGNTSATASSFGNSIPP